MTRLDRLPVSGAVLGIDVGYSATERSSAVCCLAWNAHYAEWTIRRFRAIPSERESAIAESARGRPLLAAAFDGPLKAGLEAVGHYRMAERILTASSLQKRIGKPGQAHAPVGRKLNDAANACARDVLRLCRVERALHAVRIDDKSIVEAFPSSFLGVMIDDPSILSVKRNNRSDRYFMYLTSAGILDNLLQYLLPERVADKSFYSVTNHDDRAAVVCALTALAVAADDFTAVGDVDGWIILPPRRFIREWAWAALEASAGKELRGCLYQTGRRMASGRLMAPVQVPISLGQQRHDGEGIPPVPVNTDLLIEKIRALPEERLNEVEDFVDFIRLREQQRTLTRDAAGASATAFAAVWNNPEDDVYDAL